MKLIAFIFLSFLSTVLADSDYVSEDDVEFDYDEGFNWISDKKLLWTGGKIKYKFIDSSYNDTEKAIIRQMMEQITSQLTKDCISFDEVDQESDCKLCLSFVKTSTKCKASIGTLDGWTRDSVTGSLYKVMTERTTWANAKYYCESVNAELASMRTFQESEFIKGFVDSISSISTGIIWLGGNDIEREGSWFWTDKTPFLFTDWHPPEYPNNYRGNENCLWANKGQDWNWNDVICSDTRPYGLCKIPGKLDGWTIDPVTGSMYKVMTEQSTWAFAKYYCESVESAELASIRTLEESVFIKDFLKTISSISTELIWLGGFAIPTEKSWLWTDESPITYTDWFTGEPNNGFGPGICLTASSGKDWKWIDIKCSETRPYGLCKIPA